MNKSVDVAMQGAASVLCICLFAILLPFCWVMEMARGRTAIKNDGELASLVFARECEPVRERGD